MVDAVVNLRAGMKIPIFATLTAAAGGTVAVQYGATATLYDAAGTAVAGLSDVPVSGYDAGARAAARVWYLLDTSSSGANLAPGAYTLTFTIPVVGDDGIARVEEPSVRVEVDAASG